MPGVTVAPIVLSNLLAQLRSRENLDGVEIGTALRFDAEEGVAIDRVTATGSYVAMRRPSPCREETLSVIGFAWCSKPGAGEETAAEARDRAYALLNEIAAQVYADPMIDNAFPNGGTGADLVRYDLEQFIGDGTRQALIEFQIDINARLTT